MSIDLKRYNTEKVKLDTLYKKDIIDQKEVDKIIFNGKETKEINRNKFLSSYNLVLKDEKSVKDMEKRIIDQKDSLSELQTLSAQSTDIEQKKDLNNQINELNKRILETEKNKKQVIKDISEMRKKLLDDVKKLNVVIPLQK